MLSNISFESMAGFRSTVVLTGIKRFLKMKACVKMNVI